MEIACSYGSAANLRSFKFTMTDIVFPDYGRNWSLNELIGNTIGFESMDTDEDAAKYIEAEVINGKATYNP